MNRNNYDREERTRGLRRAFQIEEKSADNPKLPFMETVDLIQRAISNSILQRDPKNSSHVLVYRKGTDISLEGWYSEKIEMVAQELMYDATGIKMLQDTLQKKERNRESKGI